MLGNQSHAPICAYTTVSVYTGFVNVLCEVLRTLDHHCLAVDLCFWPVYWLSHHMYMKFRYLLCQWSASQCRLQQGKLRGGKVIVVQHPLWLFTLSPCYCCFRIGCNKQACLLETRRQTVPNLCWETISSQQQLLSSSSIYFAELQSFLKMSLLSLCCKSKDLKHLNLTQGYDLIMDLQKRISFFYYFVL
jgi:hypothetical protein